jgi:hypothetical protein
MKTERILKKRLGALERTRKRKERFEAARIIQPKKKSKGRTLKRKLGALCPFCYKHTLQELNFRNLGCNMEIGGCGVTVNKKDMEVKHSIGKYSQCKNTKPTKVSSL